MPNVPQSLPASSSQNRDSSENSLFLQLWAAGASMVIVTGAGATGAGASVVGVCASAEAPGDGGRLAAALGCCAAQRSKQISRASLSPVRFAHSCQAVGTAEIFIPFWPLAPVVTAQDAIKTAVNNGFVVGLPGGTRWAIILGFKLAATSDRTRRRLCCLRILRLLRKLRAQRAQLGAWVFLGCGLVQRHLGNEAAGQ